MKWELIRRLRRSGKLAMFGFVMAGLLWAQSTAVAQTAFDSPQQGVAALIDAAAKGDVAALRKIFGPDGDDLISSGDPVQDRNHLREFAEKAREKKSVAVDPHHANRAIVSVGNDDWPFPIPLAKRKGKWSFDVKAGHDEILFRRIGANELDAIQVCRGFVEAQHEYAELARKLTGIAQYAQKIISTPGKRDGLFWQNQDGTPGGPVSEAVARAIEEGYSLGVQSGYHGYYFRVLKGQGPAAPLGRLDYVIKGIMIGGFALLAVPAEYGVSGVKSFIVSHDGVVYERDLGPKTLEIARQTELFNPDKAWRPTDDEWPAEANR